MTTREILADTLKNGRPCILVLGQDASSIEDRPDPVLELFLTHLSRPATAPRTWRALLAPPLISEDLAWVTERFERNVVNESLEMTLDLPWSAVFTSSIDPQVTRRLESRGREPEAILAADHHPAVPRSTVRPPVYFLYGRSSDQHDSTRPPRSIAELKRRNAKHVAPLLSRLEETATVLGTIVIDGYVPERDWLELDELFGAIPVGHGQKVLWFGVEGVPEHELVRELERAGNLFFEARRLGAIVAELEARGELAPPQQFRSGREIVSLGGDRILNVPPALRLRVEASAAIVDDDWMDSPTPLAPHATAEAFQRFHGDPGSPRGIVEGMMRGFAIERPFERRLRDRVDAQLSRRDELDRVVLLHGQSGTGKTFACARLVTSLRSARKLPVLFALGRVPPATDVDAFGLLAEESGAAAIVVVCDANTGPGPYIRLAEALSSRGRRALVVGTSYRLEDAGRLPLDLIEAHAEATEIERMAVVDLVKKHVPGAEVALKVVREEDAASVFALLYRVLAYGRERLVSGVSGEARATEEIVRERSRAKPPRIATQLAHALVTAGLHHGQLPIFDGEVDALFGRDAPGRLIDLVMSVGRLGLFVPLSLVMRTLRAQTTNLVFTEIATLFRELDLFRWKHDEEGSELLVGPRLQLEAQLIARRRLGGWRSEVECLLKLIENVRPFAVDGGVEREFLFDLLHKVDRRGPYGKEFAGGYLSMAEALTRLRKTHGLDDVSLILKESGFRRDYLYIHMNDEALSGVERDRVLNDARSAVDDAIRRVDLGEMKSSPRARRDLLVERAALYGYLAVGHAARGAKPDEVWADYLAARAASRKAIFLAPNYYPYDVGLWTTADLLSGRVSTRLSAAQQAELRADLYSLLDQLSVDDFTTEQTLQYLERRDQVGRLLGDAVLSGEARAEIRVKDPALATYLDAREIAGPVFVKKGESLGSTARSSAAQALAILRAAPEVCRVDARCLLLQLELEWTSATGERLLREERRPLPADAAGRDELFRLVTALRAQNGDVLDFRLRFLQAVLLWARGDIKTAEIEWRALGRETDLEVRGRTHRRLFIADADGSPTRFKGRLVRQRPNQNWVVEVDSLRGSVDLLATDFRSTQLAAGRAPPEFAIAFNYIGPIADPLDRYRGRP